ncbi:MAG: YkvA family protein [Cetobacterium sp.]|uniref:YkvA family protein n=1 Tax=Cetobacterium sp. TaxID=2071632 RepID=UPI003F2F53C1
MNKVILKFFKSFEGRKLTSNDLKLAVKKAINLGSTTEDLLLIINLIKDTKNKKYKLDKKSFFILTAAIVYVISPIDAVSDFIPVLGWVDDASVIGYVARAYCGVLKDYKDFSIKNFEKKKDII